MSSSVMSGLKSVLMRGWRERWTDEQWSFAVKQHIPPSATGDSCQLADILLEQALIGPSPNLQLLSYLRHAVATQMISCGATIGNLVKHTDVSRGHCILSLLQFATDTLVPNIRVLEDSSTGNCLALSKSVLMLLTWLLNIIAETSQQHQHCGTNTTDRTLGLPLPAADDACPHLSIVDSACRVVELLTSSKPVALLLHIGYLDDDDLAEQFNNLLTEFGNTRVYLDGDRKALVQSAVKCATGIKTLQHSSGVVVDLSNHLLNICVNVVVSVEAILNPTNDSYILAQLLQLLQNMQGLSLTDLCVELMRSCLMGIADVVGRPDEIKLAAFTFLKLPGVIQHLITASGSTQVEESGKSDSSLYRALIRLLVHSPLLDLVDTKCNCDCLHYLLHEFSNKYSLLTEEESRQIHNKRRAESLRPPDSDGTHAAGTQQSSLVLVLRAEPTLTTIFSTLRAEVARSPEAVLSILSQMISGKSFELILSAAAFTGRLPDFTVELVKFNEMSKAATGETTRAAEMRSQLFDMSFLMLCHIIQLYGIEVVSSNSENTSSFIVQWAIRCLPEDGKFKSLDLLSPPDSNRVEMLLGQFSTPSSELRVNLTRWHEVYHNAPFAIKEVLLAWLHGAVNSEHVMSVLDNTKSTMCSLPVIIAAWLCSYIVVSDGEIRQRAMHMLQQLTTPTTTTDSSTQYYSDRSHLMQAILSKMVQGLLPSSSPSRSHLLTASAPSQSASCEVLLSTFRSVLSNGCISVDEIHKLDSLLTVGGPAWYVEHLVRSLLTYDRPEDLYQGVGLLYALFHVDIDNLTLSLLNFTLPNLLLLKSTVHSTTTTPPGGPVSSGSLTSSSALSLKLLTDPRGSALAKLTVMCLNLACASRQIAASSEGAVYRGRKRTRADVQIEEWNGDDADDSVDDAEWSRDDVNSDGKLRKQMIEEDAIGGSVLPLPQSGTDDAFNLPVSEFLTTTTSDSTNRRTDLRPRFDTKDLLSRSLLRLFRLMHAIIAEKYVSPRSAFIASFLRETLRIGPPTSRFIIQFMPCSMVMMLARTLPSEFDTDVLVQLCDLTTTSGRRTASKVIAQHARYLAAAEASAR